MDIVLLLIRLLLAGIFTTSGLAKLVDRPGSRQAMLDFGVPARLATPFALCLPLLELVVAASLVPTISAWVGAIGALGLLLLFTTAVGYHLARGHTPRCHCFGQASSRPIGWTTLVRNLILSALAGLVIGFGHTNAGASVIGWLEPMTIFERVTLATGGLSLVLLVAEGVALLRLLRLQKDLLHRFQQIATTSPVTPRKAPKDSLSPVRATTPAPTFRLPDLSDKLVSLDGLLASGNPVLLIFSDPECGSCTSLLPEISRWQYEHAHRLTLALISQGTPEANRAKVSQHGIAPVLLQRDREVAEAYQAQGTPCAALVHTDGIIRSEPTCGAEQIRALVAQVVGLPTLVSLPAATGRENGHALPIVASHGKMTADVLSNGSSGSHRGETAPAFTLPDLNGHMISLADFRGRPTLLLFWNPGCGFCQQMLADLKNWEAELSKEGPLLFVISAGRAEENRRMGLRSPIVLDDNFTIGPLFGAHGTPMAVLIDANGNIASEVASGSSNVLTLARSNQNLA